MNNYDMNEKSLTYENQIFLTSNNTIKGKQFDEISCENFIKILKENNRNGGKITRVDDTIFKFEYLDIQEVSSKVFYLVIDKKIMNDFDQEIYTSFTSELKNVLNERYKKSNKRILLTNDDKKSDKNLKVSWKKYLKNLRNDFYDLPKIIENNITSKIWPYNVVAGLLDIELETIIGLMLAANVFLTMFLLPNILPVPYNFFEIPGLLSSLYLVGAPLVTCIVDYVKIRIKRLKEYIENRKNNKKEKEDDKQIIIKNIEKAVTNNNIFNLDKDDINCSTILNNLLSIMQKLHLQINEIIDTNKKTQFNLELLSLFEKFFQNINIIVINNDQELLLELLINIKNCIIPNVKRIKRMVYQQYIEESTLKINDSVQLCLDKKNDEKNRKTNEVDSDISCSSILKSLQEKLNKLNALIDTLKNDESKSEFKQNIKNIYDDYNSYIEKIEYNKRNEKTILFNLKNLLIPRLELLEDKVYKKIIEQTYADLEDRLKVEIEKRKEKVIE